MAPPRKSPLMMLLGAIFFFSAQVFAVSAVLGVDLGTEYIKAALVKPGIPLEIVLTKDSRRKETSAVAFKPTKGTPKDGQFPERLYGADAMALSPRFPSDVFPNLKTILGLPVGHSIVQEYVARHPALQLEAHSTRNTAAFKSKAFTAEEEAWMVEELLAMELQSIQKNAELAAGDGSTIHSVVLTVPPFYTTEEKRAIQSASELAGLKVLSLISDGLAVGLNYATSRQFPNINEGAKPEYHMVFDMGAGTTIATVMKFQSRNVKDVGKYNKTVQEIQVLGSGHDRTLGGDALNNLIIDDMVAQFVESKGAQKASIAAESVKSHGRTMAKLFNQVGKLRHILSANQNTAASFEGLYDDVDFKYKITRAEFETMAASHAERVGDVIKTAVKMSGLDIADIDSVILNGGASRTPFVQKALESFLGSSDKIRTNVNADEAAVFGAGFRAAELSPSFRVKEIRISEGSGFPAGLKWTNNKRKVQRQRVWTPMSPLGAAPKEVTFTEQEDFDISFWQEINSEDRDVKAITTKNLTATVAAMKEKYPSCEESDIRFKLGMKLSSDNGEVQVVKAVVECEAEVTEKDGFVDGVKNLFGFGKKDQQPLKEGEDAESAEASAEASASTETSESFTASSDKNEASDASQEAKTEVKKKQTVSIPVDFTIENRGTPDLTKEQVAKSKGRLEAFANSDKARFAREEALNQLEGYIYRVRDLVEGEAFIQMSTEKERAKIADLGQATSEWLSDESDSATKDELKAKLEGLQKLVTPIAKRVEEAEQRPALVTQLKEVLNQTNSFVANIRKQIDEYDAWHASASASASSSTTAAASESSPDFDGLEDADAPPPTMDNLVKEKGPVPPLYKMEDIEEVEKLEKSTSEWLSKLETKQAALSDTQDPVLTVKDLKSKREKLDKAGMDLAMKGVRDFESMKKKAEKAKKKNNKSKSKGTKTDSGEPAGKTIEINPKDFKFEDGEKPTEEQIQAILDKIQKQKAEQGGEKQTHDEL